MKPKFIIDDHIPFIKGVFDKVADIDYLAAKEITPEVVKNADALIIRTRTKCNADLLDGSKVKFIATATIGIDHIDTGYCDANGIVWRNAPGCNARSVAQWLGSAIAIWSKKNNVSPFGKTIGIIGHGHVGQQVEKLAGLLDMKVILNDPPKAKLGCAGYSNLDVVAEMCDIISFHTPLTLDGEFKTHYLADSAFFNSLKRKPLIVNAARGGVINEADLLNAIDLGLVGDCAIDCWENEPDTNDALRNFALVSTPHIAGYSADGKYNATLQTVKSISDFFGLTPNMSEALPPQKIIKTNKENLLEVFLKTYDINDDSNVLKFHHELFENHRSHYPMRREIDIILEKE